MKYIILQLFLISHLSFSQSFFTPGYIILKNQNDTIRGQIDDRNWAINPKEILFKSENSESSIYKIKELKAFGIFGKDHYQVKKVDLDTTPLNLQDLLKSSKMIFSKDTTLALRIFIKANVSLLFLLDATSKSHYFYSTGNETVELLFHQYLREKSSTDLLVSNPIYRTQLENLFSKCSKKISTKNIEYDQKSMINKFIEFNNCLGSSSTCYVKTKLDMPKIGFGVSVGEMIGKAYHYSQNPSGNDFKYLGSNIYSSPLLGINSTIYSRRNHGNEMFTFELMYQPLKIWNLDKSAFVGRNAKYLGILYKKRKDTSNKVRPYLGGGLNLCFYSNGSNRLGSNQLFGGSKSTNYLLVMEGGTEIGKFSFGAKLNFSQRNFQFYNITTTISETVLSKLSSQFMLSYRIR